MVRTLSLIPSLVLMENSTIPNLFPSPLPYRSMLRDESIYPHPETFNPDRFMRDGKLNSDVRDPSLIVFGFGRRSVNIPS
jgi:cytochrome P450